MSTTNTASPNILVDFYQAFTTGDASSLDHVFAPDWIDHTPLAGRVNTLDGIKGAVVGLGGALSNTIVAMDDVIIQGDKLVVRWHITGIQSGLMFGQSATGKQISFFAIDIHRVAYGTPEDILGHSENRNARIIESWHLEDNLSLLAQIGALPALS